MAESGLTLAWAELKQATGKFLGVGSVIANWSTADAARIEDIVQSGVRRVYYPTAVGPGFAGHEWSWLRPTTTLTLAVGTGDYDLPDDFGRLVGDMHYPADEYRPSIHQSSLNTIYELRASRAETGYANVCATRFKASTGSAGQKQEVLFYPEPDAIKVLTYQYEAYQAALSDAFPYPLGGMQLSELYKKSCLAVVESDVLLEEGVHTKQFKEMLVDQIQRDRQRGAKSFGQMGHLEQPEMREFRRGNTGATYDMTYKGVPV